MRTIALATVGAAVLASGAAAAKPNPVTWKALHRPLHLPRLAPGSHCPVTPRHRVRLDSRNTQELPGTGPAYPNFGGDGTMTVFMPPLESQVDFAGTGWGGNKTLWWVRSSYRGRVLIRGRQLDGTNLVRFDGTAHRLPPTEIRIDARAGAGARDRPSYTRVRAAGCYAFQIDGAAFSRAVVFVARRVMPPPIE